MNMDGTNILTLLLNQNGKLKYSNLNKLKDKNNELYQDVINLYPDINLNTVTLSEIIYRIKNNINEIPKCPVCGNLVLFKVKNHKYLTFCSSECLNSEKGKLYTINKRVNTNIKKYGNACPMQNKDIHDEIVNKWLEHYGETNPNKSLEVKNKQVETKKERYGLHLENVTDKIKQTCLLKYGVDNVRKSDWFKEHYKLVMREKYGVDNYSLTEDYKIKYKQTSIKQYGVDNYSKTSLFKNLISTKIIPKIFNNEHYRFPKSEQYAYNYLLEYFNKDDIIRQYKSDEYPYFCDLFIKPLNLYIEIQGHWTHGLHPFDENNKNDILLFEQYKLKLLEGKEYYNDIIKIWTINDVKKRNIAKENNLNYLEIFSYNKDDIQLLLNKEIVSFINKY